MKKGIASIKKIKPLHLELSVLFILSCLAVLYFSWGLTSWKFSYVGDEWYLYEYAKGIAEKNLIVNPLDMVGAHAEQRILGSVWQALFIKIFSFAPVLGWRFSNIILIIPINFFYFYWLKNYFSSTMAIISTALLNCSFYLANFFKIGYLNPLAFTLFITSLYFSARAGKSNKIKDFILLAISLGLSFYVYIGPLFPLIIWPLLLPALKKKKAKFIRNFIFLILCYSLIILLGLTTSSSAWQEVFKKTIIKREFSSNWQIFINIFRNFLLFYKNYDYLYNHFVSGPYVDIITRALLFVGILISFLKIRKPSYTLILVTYFMTNIIIGITSPYSYTPTTRGIFFLPFGFLFAGIALDKTRRILKWQGIILVLIAILAMNLYQGQVRVFKEVGHHGFSLVIKELQESKKEQLSTKVVLLTSDLLQFNHQNIFYLQRQYHLESVPFLQMKTGDFSCKQVKESKVLFFERDFKAEETLRLASCSDKFTTDKITNYYIY